MMHIGFLTPEYPHDRSTPAAGIGTSIKNMATVLIKKGVNVSVFVYGQKEDAVFITNGIKFHLIKQRKYAFLGWYLYRKFLQDYLNGHIEKDNIDALEAPDWTGITAFMKLNCLLVIRMNGSDAYFCSLENRSQKKKNFWFEKRALKGADHLLSVSEFTASETAKIFGLKKKITVIPNSVDLEVFEPKTDQVVPNTLLYFGSIIRKKGVLELVEIFNMLCESKPNVKLFIAGKDVPDQKTGVSTRELMLKSFSPAAAKKVTWLGILSYEKMRQQIAMAQVIVLPSFAEALPMTWIEAMAMEKALVTSNTGWAQEVMIDGKTGFMVNPKNHTTYAEKIRFLLDNREKAEAMGKAARLQVMKKFSSEVVVNWNISFYKKIMGNS